jgi:hypothetical protein
MKVVDYKGCEIEPRPQELLDGTFAVEAWVYDRRTADLRMRHYFGPRPVDTRDEAVIAAIRLGYDAVDQGLPERLEE